MNELLSDEVKSSPEYKTFVDLRTRCVDEILKEVEKANYFRPRGAVESLSNTIAHKVVAIVRKYNRQWNEAAEKSPAMIKDGFVLVMKQDLIAMNINKELNAALAYL